MANLIINLNEIVEKRRKAQIVLPYGTKEDKKEIRLRVDIDDDEVKMYLEAISSASKKEDDSEAGEKLAIKNVLKVLTIEEDVHLWDDFDEFFAGDAGILVFRSIMSKVEEKFFEVKTGKESEGTK